jgi:hypothetical protein
MASQEEDELLDLHTAAKRLGKKIGGLRGWVLRRKIDYVKVGVNVKIRESTIRKILEQGTVLALDRSKTGAAEVTNNHPKSKPSSAKR